MLCYAGFQLASLVGEVLALKKYVSLRGPRGDWLEFGGVLKACTAFSEKIGRQGTAFVDRDQLIPRRSRFFEDVCHLKREGAARFVANMRKAVAEIVRPSSGPR